MFRYSGDGGVVAMEVLRKDQVPRYIRDGITSYLLVSATNCGAKHVTTTLVEMEPGGKQTVHSHETEQVYTILKGHGEMVVAGETRRVCAGDCVFIPSNDPHGLLNTGDEVLTYISAGSPVFGAEKEQELWPLPPSSDSPL